MNFDVIETTFPNHVSLQGRLANEFKISFGQSPAVAGIMAETADKLYKLEADLTTPGTILYSAVHLSEPSGRPLNMCKRVSVKLSIWEHSDDLINDMTSRRKVVLKRIVIQAYDQDALLTIKDCERIMICSERTIKKYLSDFKSEGIYLPLRGYVQSTGRGQTHKTEIINFYLDGMQLTEIQYRSYHSLQAITRYISMFSRIIVCHVKQKMKLGDIATVVKASPELVKQYLKIYDGYSKEDNERLSLILNPEELDNFIMPLKKKVKK